VTIDAMGTQQAMAQTIRDRDADIAQAQALVNEYKARKKVEKKPPSRRR
jgi:predicted transposase YbfD/YdcC